MMKTALTFSLTLFLSGLISAQWMSPVNEQLPKPDDFTQGVASIQYIPAQASEEVENYQLFKLNKKGQFKLKELYKNGALYEKVSYSYHETGDMATERKEVQRGKEVDIRVNYLYNDKQQLLAEQHYEDDARVAELKYDYDSLGRIKSKLQYFYDNFEENDTASSGTYTYTPSSKEIYAYSADGRTITHISYTHNPAAKSDDPFYITRKEIRHYADAQQEVLLKWSVYTGSIMQEPLKFSHQYVFSYNDRELISEVKVLNEKGELSSKLGDAFLKLEYDRSGTVIKSESYDPETEELIRTFELSYDANGKLNQLELVFHQLELIEAKGSGQQLRMSYDAQGNWTHAVSFKNGKRSNTQKRLLEYH